MSLLNYSGNVMVCCRHYNVIVNVKYGPFKYYFTIMAVHITCQNCNGISLACNM